MKFAVLFLVFLTNHALSCEIKLAPKLIIVNEGQKSLENIKSDNCSAEQLRDFSSFIHSASGRISVTHHNNQSDFKIWSPTPTIEILHIRDLIAKKYQAYSKENYNRIKLPLNHSLFLLNKNEKVDIKCFNCLESSPVNLNFLISFHDFYQESYRFKLEAKKVHIFSVYKATRDIPVFSENLNPNDFELQEIETNSSNHYFTQMNNIHYMKNTRSIKKGEVILSSHLAAKNLIKIGQIVKVNVSSKNIFLQTQAKALEVGRIDQTIQVKGLKNQKVYQVTVIAPGETKVEL